MFRRHLHDMKSTIPYEPVDTIQDASPYINGYLGFRARIGPTTGALIPGPLHDSLKKRAQRSSNKCRNDVLAICVCGVPLLFFFYCESPNVILFVRMTSMVELLSDVDLNAI